MEGLPDELVLAVLGHIEPLSDAGVVNRTCRRWCRLMLDPQLWRAFFERTFPDRFTSMPDNVRRLLAPDDDDDGDGLGRAADDDEGSGGRDTTPWRPMFVERALELKKRLAELETKPERWNKYQGWEWRVAAAAKVGCLRLVKEWTHRLLDEYEALFGGPTEVQQDERLRRCLSFINLDCKYHQSRSVADIGLRKALRSAPTAKFFLDLGANISSVSLHKAVESGNRHLVALLIAHGAVLSAFYDYNHPLAAAVKKGDMAMVKLLLRQGIQMVKSGEEAIGAGRLDILRVLLEHGLQPSIDDVHAMLGLGSSVRRKVAREDYMEMLRLLVPAGLRSHVLANSPKSFRLFTSSILRETGNTEICRLLIENGADINAPSSLSNPRYYYWNDRPKTPLHCAAEEKNEKLAKCLLECGARTDVKTYYTGCHLTAHSLARQMGHEAMARLIAKHNNMKKKSITPSDGSSQRGNKGEGSSSPSSISVSSSRGKKKRKHEEIEKEDKELNDHDDQPTNPDNNNSMDASKQNKKSKKQKKRDDTTVKMSEEKQHEQELEAQVRRLAKLGDGAKLDVFSLRCVLKRAGVAAKEMPKRKREMLERAVQCLVSGSACASVCEQSPSDV